MKNLTPISVETISFCDQLIILESDEAKMEIHLKKQELFTSLDALKKEGLEGEVLKLHLADSSQEKIDQLEKELSETEIRQADLNAKFEELTNQLTKSQSDFQAQSALLVKAQDDLVSANAKIAELEKAKEVQPIAEPVQ